MMMWDPEHEIGFAYVPATVVWYTQALGAHVQSVFMECFNKLNGNIEMAAKIKGWLKGKLIPVSIIRCPFKNHKVLNYD